MTRNWRVDEEALIPNWKGFSLFLAPHRGAFLSFSHPLAEELSSTECWTNEHGPAKKSDNVLSRRCDLTSDFSRRGHILFQLFLSKGSLL